MKINEEQAESYLSEGAKIMREFNNALKEAHWLIERARCQGEYGLSEEWQARYKEWKNEVGI